MGLLLAELACGLLFAAARLALHDIVQTLPHSTLQYACSCFVAGRRPGIAFVVCDFSQVTYLQQRLLACGWRRAHLQRGRQQDERQGLHGHGHGCRLWAPKRKFGSPARWRWPPASSCVPPPQLLIQCGTLPSRLLQQSAAECRLDRLCRSCWSGTSLSLR